MGKSFIGLVIQLESVVECKSGLREVMADTIDVNLAELTKFFDNMVDQRVFNHELLRELYGGAIVLLSAIMIAHNRKTDSLKKLISPLNLEKATAIADKFMTP